MLLRTKLFLPKHRSAAVRRARLFNQLDEASESTLTLVSAPAGYGKTWVVGEWLHERQVPAGWYSVDVDDDDPGRFWAYLVEALRSIAPAVGQQASELLASSVPHSVHSLVGVLVNEIAERQESLTCVLDDYHQIGSEQVHEGLIFLVENAPSNLHLIMTTRSDPPWPLARLRAERRVSELRAADLRFDRAETEELMRSSGLTLSRGGVEQLEERTEGWVAGLRMAALSMRGRDDLDAFVADFAGSHRFVLDYLTEEVLARCSDDVLRFLVRTSILERLEGTLCDAVTGTSGGAEMLLSLERDHLFTDPLDDERTWYCYHPLFRDVLRSRLRASGADLESDLHRRAARWFEASGYVDEAIGHSLDGGDSDRAARLIGEAASATFVVGNQSRLLGWLDGLSPEAIACAPTLALARAWARFVLGDLAGIDASLGVAAHAIATSADASRRPGLEAQLEAMRAWIAYQQGDLDDCIELAETAIAALPADGIVSARIVSAALGSALVLRGELDRAQTYLEETRLASRRANDRLTESLALAITGQVELVRGRLEHAATACRLAIDAGTLAGEPLPSVGIAQVLLGAVLREQADMAEAQRVLISGIAICERAMGLPEWVFEGNVTLARVLLAGGDRERAATHASRADRLYESEIEPGGMEPLVRRALGYREAYRAAALGAPDRHGGLIEPLSERELEVLGRVAAGRSNQEIADDLFISLNTVKWHARNAYGKLGVGRRTQAVERARELGLL